MKVFFTPYRLPICFVFWQTKGHSIETLCPKSEGRYLDSGWYHENFSLS